MLPPQVIGSRLRGAANALYFLFGKRALDILGALVGLVASSPALFVCAVVIWLDSRGPIFYRQKRVGQHGRLFEIIKLRTMIAGADKLGPQLTSSEDRRITSVGNILRKTKLDEIPQLLNVLRGEMSLVGPRPEVPEYVIQYTCTQRRLLDVRPGLTGPASLAFIDEEQVLTSEPDKENFYLHVLMPAKLDLDLAYCGMISFFGDIKLILLTVTRTIRRMVNLLNRARHPLRCEGRAAWPLEPAAQNGSSKKTPEHGDGVASWRVPSKL